MLNLILGRAGTGKTMHVMSDIRRRGAAGETNLLLIVPDQYSHDAEKQLCAVCGDRLSLYGETLSFSRLCNRVFSETGGAPVRIVDNAGQTLLMHRALEYTAPQLKVFGTKGLRTEILEKLLTAVKEFKSLNISPDLLNQTAERTESPLSDKLRDLALIFSAYDALLRERGYDSADRLTLLANMIEDSTVGNTGHIYFDGFNDFTVQELRVIEKLLSKNAELTVCLTCDLFSDEEEVFALPRKTVDQLRRLAGEYGVEIEETRFPDYHIPGSRTGELIFLEKHFFEQGKTEYTEQCRAITVYSAPTRYAECEYAAYIVWSLVRSGYRWRDIGVVARDWEEYSPICENIFEKYSVPFFSSGKASILDKPPVALINSALEIAVAGWEYRSVFKYLKTGLAGVTADECAELENYVLMWKIRGAMWEKDWKLPPHGRVKEDDLGALARINDLRRMITEPISKLSAGIRGDTEANAKLQAVLGFLEDIRFRERLSISADELEKRGEARLADEYAQLWGIIKNAIGQASGILGGSTLNAQEFKKLLLLALSQYDVGVIPVALDRTAIGGMAMSRRRDLKCLIILGATDGSLPMLAKSNGALSDNEREELSLLGLDIPAGIEERFNREMNMLYSTLTLPSQELIITYPTGGGDRQSFVVTRIKEIFKLNTITMHEEDYMAAAISPCFELALMNPEFGIRNSMAAAAREYFREYSHAASSRIDTIDEIMLAGRGRLSETSAQGLYGQKLSLSASRVDKYYSCPYQYFLQSGLQLDPRATAEFDAPAAGVFMHYILEGVSRQIKATVGYKNADEEFCRTLVKRYIEQYTNEELFNFEGKKPRFIYLFHRLEDDVFRIVMDMLEELKKSDFEPLDFELDFSEIVGSDPWPATRGIVDRVDGWTHDGKLYLRVIDYKTGNIRFNLVDILHGRNMQMLIYLFALQKYGGAKYGMEIAPAGALYAPARDTILKLPRNSTEAEISAKRENELRRNGLVLNNPYVIEAMENGGTKKYLPVKVVKDEITGDSLVSREQVATLSEYIASMLNRAADEIMRGSIECVPFYKSEEDNACIYCEYRSVCAFDEQAGDRRRFVGKMKIGQVWEALETRE